MSEELKEQASDADAAPQQSYNEEDQLLFKFKIHLDRSLKMLPLISANGMRRVFVAYLKSGMEDMPTLRKEEQALFNEVLMLHDAKYALIMKAIESAEKEIKQGEESNG